MSKVLATVEARPDNHGARIIAGPSAIDCAGQGRAIEGEVVDEGFEAVEERLEWAEEVNLFITLEDEIRERQWKQVRILARIRRKHGEASVERFAFDVGISKTTAYDYLKVYDRFGYVEESDRAATLGISHYVEAAYHGTPEEAQEALGKAEDEGQSSRAMRAERQEQRRDFAEDSGEFGRAQTVPQDDLCPHCGQPIL